MPLAAQLAIVFGSFAILAFGVLLLDMHKQSKKLRQQNKDHTPPGCIDDYEHMMPYLHDTQIKEHSKH